MQDNKKDPQNKEKDQAENIDKNVTKQAHTQADKDMEDDAEFTASSPNDDLDEAESLKLGEDTPIV